MASNQTALGIELIGDEVRMALVESGPQGLSLVKAQSISASDDLARSLRALPKRPGAVTSAVSLKDAAIRILDLPPTADEHLDRVVTMEAETVLPLPVEELALAHHTLGMTEQSRVEVLVAAGRQAEVQRVLQRVNAAPWVSASVTVSSVALLNAFQQLRGPGRETVCAVLRIEEGFSELLVLERTRILGAQHLPVGCGVEASVPRPQPVPVPLGAAAEEEAEAAIGGLASPWVVTLSQQVRYALQALLYERGLSAERLYVCGKAAEQAGLDWQFSERLDIPVSLLAPASAAGPAGAQYAVAYGCAVQAAGAATVALNLTPARMAAALEVEQRRQTRFSWSALAASVVLAATLVTAAAFHQKEEALAQVEQRLAQVKGLAGSTSDDPVAAKNAAKAVTDAATVRVSPARALGVLSAALPPGTWLEQLSYNAQTGVIINGYSLDPNGAQRAQVALLRQPVFDEVMLDYRSQEEVNGAQVWGFQLSCKLKQEEKNNRRTGGR